MKCQKCGNNNQGTNSVDEAVCSKCGSPFTSQKEPDNQIDMAQAVNCSICCTDVAQDDSIVTCPDCNIAYHTECWEENKGCAAYGCQSSPPYINETNEVNNTNSCPWCGMLNSEGNIICSECGVEMDSSLKSHSFTGKVKSLICVAYSQISFNLRNLLREFLCLINIILPCFKKICLLYWHAMTNYVNIGDKATRRELYSFILVSTCISIALGSLAVSPYVLYIYWFVTLIPTVCLSIRRLRDLKLNAWYILLGPFLLILLAAPTVIETENIATVEEEKTDNK